MQGNVLQLPFGDERLVAIHCLDLVDRVEFLQECSRVMGCRGLLIVDALNRHSYGLILKRLGFRLGLLFADRLDEMDKGLPLPRGAACILLAWPALIYRQRAAMVCRPFR